MWSRVLLVSISWFASTHLSSRSSASLASSTTSGLPTTSGLDVRSVSIQSMKSSSRASNGLTGTSMILCPEPPRLPPSFKIILRTRLDRDLSFICA